MKKTLLLFPAQSRQFCSGLIAGSSSPVSEKKMQIKVYKFATALLMFTYSNHNNVLYWITDIAYYIIIKYYSTVESHGSV